MVLPVRLTHASFRNESLNRFHSIHQKAWIYGFCIDQCLCLSSWSVLSPAGHLLRTLVEVFYRFLANRWQRLCLAVTTLVVVDLKYRVVSSLSLLLPFQQFSKHLIPLLSPFLLENLQWLMFLPYLDREILFKLFLILFDISRVKC